MAIDISFTLRATTDGFKAGMASANNAVMDLKKGLREFDVGNGLKSLLGVGGIIAAFRSTINHARELRDALEEAGKPVPEATASVARLGDTLANVATVAKNAAVSILGIYTGVGDGLRRIFQNVSAEQEAAARKSMVETAKLADEADKRLAAARESNAEKVAAAESKLAELRRKNQMEQMTAEEKSAALQREIGALQAEQSEKGKESLRWRELAIAIEEKTADLFKVNADLAKQQAKAAEEEEKFREGIFKASEEMAGAMEKIREEEAAAATQRKRAAAEAAQAAQDEYNLNVKITAEKRAQATADEAKARSWAGTSGPLGMRGLDTVSNDVLQADLEQRQRRLDAARMRQGSARGVGGGSFEQENFFEFSQIASIRDELAFRQNFQRAYSRGGRSGALAEYVSQGRNAMGFDVAFANMGSWGATLSSSERAQLQSQQTLEQIKNLLTPVFKG
jgi:chemotaxis protein histidine kinase CheA